MEQAATAPGKTLSGVQKKLLAFQTSSRFQPSVRPDDPATHIAKFNRDDLPTLVQNEHLSLALGREVLGASEITRANIGRLQGVEGVVLLVERFDRDEGERLRLEDFAQILGKPRGREFDGKYNSSYEEAAEAIKQYSARPLIDLARYFELIIFNLVIGNADAHLKNFSLLERPEGLRLSPAYDLVNTLVYPFYDQEVALEIGDRKIQFDELNRGIVEKLGIAIGLPPAAVKRSLAKLSKKFEKPKMLQFRVPVQPDDFRAQYSNVVIGNAERIFK